MNVTYSVAIAFNLTVDYMATIELGELAEKSQELRSNLNKSIIMMVKQSGYKNISDLQIDVGPPSY